jgi:hypothetical protein
LQFLVNVHPEAQWVTQQVEISGDWDTWANGDRHRLQGVSDGSYKDHFGTAAFILVVADDSATCIRGRVVTPGDPEDHNAYRSELAGIYALTVIHWAVCAFYNLDAGQIELACDGKSALQQAQWQEDFINTSSPHYDLILAIRSIRNISHWTWSWRHVKGHQDSTGAELDFWAWLNIQMDSNAKQHWSDKHASTPPNKVWGEPWRVWLGNKKIASNLSRNLQDYCLAKPALAYWQEKPRIGDQLQNVDWDVIGGAMKQVSLSRQIWISKHVTGFCATGNNMLRRKARSTAQCPRCRYDETPEHVWTCRGSDAPIIWEKSLTRLKDWLQENSTHPEMSKAIIAYLEGWRNGQQESVRISQEWIGQAFSNQSTLGWRNFLEGFLHTSWQATQKIYFARIGSARSPKRWTTALIQKLWDVAWDMWEHRNDILHNQEQSILLTTLHTDIQEEFRRGPEGLPREARALFAQGCASVLAKSGEAKQQWLARIRLARLRETRMSALGDSLQQERKLMSKWLHGR